MESRSVCAALKSLDNSLDTWKTHRKTGSPINHDRSYSKWYPCRSTAQLNCCGYQRKQHFQILEIMSKRGCLNSGRKFLPTSWAQVGTFQEISFGWATPCFHVWSNFPYYFGKINTSLTFIVSEIMKMTLCRLAQHWEP